MLCDVVVVVVLLLSDAGWCAAEVPLFGALPSRYAGFRRLETVRNGRAMSVTAFGFSSGLAAGTDCVMMVIGVARDIPAARVSTSCSC